MKKIQASLEKFYDSGKSKIPGLLITLSLFLALSSNSDNAQAQVKNSTALEIKDKPQAINAKDKYFTQLINEIEREVSIENEKKILAQRKESFSALLSDFRSEVCFSKEKKEIVLDDYLGKIALTLPSVETESQFYGYISKLSSLLTSLQNDKKVLLGEESVSFSQKEVSPELIRGYADRLKEFQKPSIDKNVESSINVFEDPLVQSTLKSAETSIKEKESAYASQNQIIDSLKLKYSQLMKSIYELNNISLELSTDIKEVELYQASVGNEYSTLDALGTNITPEDFTRKVDLLKKTESLNAEHNIATDSLKNTDAALIVKNNQIPVEENALKQACEKLTSVQSMLLEEQKKQYAKISSVIQQEIKTSIENQDQQVEQQMQILKKSIEKFNNHIDSLTTALQTINSQLAVQFGAGETVIRQKEIDIQKLLKEYVKYGQELKKSYVIYKNALLQNKEAILNLDKNNPFIKTDVTKLKQEIQGIKATIEAKKVAIAAKEKEKSETIDNKKNIEIINELTSLYQDQERANVSLIQSENLLKQRTSFDEQYVEKKDQETVHIDQVIAYLDNNISSITYGVETFVYAYYMQLKKMEIQNLNVKLGDTKSIVTKDNATLVVKQKTLAEKNESVKKTTGSPSERLLQENKIRGAINLLIAEISSLQSIVTKNEKRLKTYEDQVAACVKELQDLAVLAKSSSEAYLGFAINEQQLRDIVAKNYYFYKSDKVKIRNPKDMLGFFQGMNSLLNLMKEAGIEPGFTAEDLTSLNK